MKRGFGIAATALASLAASGAAAAGCTIGKFLQLPITMSGMRPMVSAKIDGTDATFLLDSGAFYSMISPGAAAEYRLNRSAAPEGFYMSGVGGDTLAEIATVKNLTMAGVTLTRIQFLVGGSEIGATGAIGQNILGMGDAEYDLAAGAVRLMHPVGCAMSSMAYWASTGPVSFIPLEHWTPGEPHTIGPVIVNGVTMRAMFDTGASTSMISALAAAHAGVKLDGPGVKPGEMSSGIGHHMVKSWTARFADVKIGGEELRNTTLSIADVNLDVDMLIGADFFLSHRVYVAKSQERMYFTYNGGPIFRTVSAPPPRQLGADGKPFVAPAAGPDPTDADGFARRGAALGAQDDYAHGIADLTRAIALAPKEPRYLLERAELHGENKEARLARADLDQALALAPNQPQALIDRAAWNIVDGQKPAAIADLDRAARLLAKASDLRLRIADLYLVADNFGPSIEQYSLWIAVHPVDNRRPDAMNGRCWVRALAGRELDQALADCNAAVRTLPGKSNALDSRGLVRLRMGDPMGAITDYDAALRIDPKLEWSLYGRGVAKMRLGRKAEGEADLKASAALDPKLAERAKGYGIVP